MQAVNIVIAIDQNYQDMAEVFLKSLCIYHQNMKIFILSAQDLNQEFKVSLYNNLIKVIERKNIKFNFVIIDIDQQNFKQNGYISQSTYLRYYIEDIFPLGISNDWLYIDVDTLIIGDIFKPFQLPKFKDYALACVSDIFVNKNPAHVQKISGTDYFNAGVLYINAEKWVGTKQKLLEITKKHHDDFLYGDQDALNMLFKDAWLKLPTEYNTQFDHQLSNEEYNLNAKILHFTGQNKPFHLLNNKENSHYPNLQRYRDYYELSWDNIAKIKSVAVVTSTVGRVELERAILSVKQQNYPCKHYIFIDGEQYFHKVKPLQEKYPDVIFTFLPMNTGANGWTNSYINAIAPFLVKEEIICYLDDDNWYEPHHIQSIVQGFNAYENIDVVYNLRRLMKETGEYLCDDNLESLGYYSNGEYIDVFFTFNEIYQGVRLLCHRGYLVDTNCLALNINTAREFAHYWTMSKQNDHYIWHQCLQQNKRIYATAQRTVNYTINIEGHKILEQVLKDFQCKPEQETDLKYKLIKESNNITFNRLQNKESFWLKPSVYIDGKVIDVDY